MAANINVSYSREISNIPTGGQKGVWEFGIGEYGFSFYHSSFSNQLKLAKAEARKMGVSRIEVIRKIS